MACHSRVGCAAGGGAAPTPVRPRLAAPATHRRPLPPPTAPAPPPLQYPAAVDYTEPIAQVYNKKRPSIVVQAVSEADVRATVAFAAAHRAPLCVRAGGHDTAGASLCAGILLELEKMNKVGGPLFERLRGCTARGASGPPCGGVLLELQRMDRGARRFRRVNVVPAARPRRGPGRLAGAALSSPGTQRGCGERAARRGRRRCNPSPHAPACPALPPHTPHPPQIVVDKARLQFVAQAGTRFQKVRAPAAPRRARPCLPPRVRTRPPAHLSSSMLMLTHRRLPPWLLPLSTPPPPTPTAKPTPTPHPHSPRFSTRSSPWACQPSPATARPWVRMAARGAGRCSRLLLRAAGRRRLACTRAISARHPCPPAATSCHHLHPPLACPPLAHRPPIHRSAAYTRPPTPQAGLAGFSMGGGWGWLSKQHGLGLDNVLAYRVVLANGTVVDATAANEPDLFWCAAPRSAQRAALGLRTWMLIRGCACRPRAARRARLGSAACLLR